jgi:hypothetical protein
MADDSQSGDDVDKDGDDDAAVEKDASTLIQALVGPPVAPSTRDLAPDVREVSAGGAWAASSAGAAASPTAAGPGSAGASARSAFVLERTEPARVAAPAPAKAPGER